MKEIREVSIARDEQVIAWRRIVICPEHHVDQHLLVNSIFSSGGDVVEGDAGGGEGFQDTRGDTGGVAVGEERYRALAACRGERGDDVVRYAVGVAAAGGDGAPVNVPPNRRLCLRRLRAQSAIVPHSSCLPVRRTRRLA